MAALHEALTQPAPGATVRVAFLGDPVFGPADVLYFPGYGLYKVTNIITNGPLHRTYDLYFYGKTGAGQNIIPAGTAAILEAEGVTHSVLPYASVIALNFREPDYRSLTLTDNITFNTQNHQPAKSIVVKIRNSSGTLSRNLTFPPSWIFIGSAGRPSTIGPSKTGILSITCFGTSDADVIAAWAVQA